MKYSQNLESGFNPEECFINCRGIWINFLSVELARTVLSPIQATLILSMSSLQFCPV